MNISGGLPLHESPESSALAKKSLAKSLTNAGSTDSKIEPDLSSSSVEVEVTLVQPVDKASDSQQATDYSKSSLSKNDNGQISSSELAQQSSTSQSQQPTQAVVQDSAQEAIASRTDEPPVVPKSSSVTPEPSVAPKSSSPAPEPSAVPNPSAAPEPAAAPELTGQSGGVNSADQARHQAQVERQEQSLLQALKSRDREVKRHEQTHAQAGAPYTSSPTYEFATGPDGVRYAVGGEVSIDTTPIEGDPEATLEKSEVIQQAALAVSEPSAQDRRVASEASQMAAKARLELLQLKLSEPQNTDQNRAPDQSIPAGMPEGEVVINRHQGEGNAVKLNNPESSNTEQATTEQANTEQANTEQANTVSSNKKDQQQQARIDALRPEVFGTVDPGKVDLQITQADAEVPEEKASLATEASPSNNDDESTADSVNLESSQTALEAFEQTYGSIENLTENFANLALYGEDRAAIEKFFNDYA